MAIDKGARIAAQLRREALAWKRRLGAADDTPAVQAAFMTWILSEPRHECAFREASRLEAGLARLAEDGPGRADAWADGIPADVAGDDLLDLQLLDLGPAICESCGQPLWASDPGVLVLTDPPATPDAATVAAGAAWVVALTTSAPAPDLDGLRDWLSLDPRHRVAFLRALLPP